MSPQDSSSVMSLKQIFCPALLVVSLWLAVAPCTEGSCTEQGWFGPNCTFKCRCGKNATCDKVSGECGPNTECSTGWFGPGCQYENILHGLWKQGSPSFLSDENKLTCNPDREALELKTHFAWNFRVFWIRIWTDIDMSSYDLFFEIEEGECTNLKFYRISETTFDINCESTKNNAAFLFRGKAVGHICDIKSSGGRNLALRQKAVQSSDFKGLPLKDVQASNAVDGSLDTCQQTGRVKGWPWWTVYFSFYCTAVRIIYYKNIQYRDQFNDIYTHIYNNSKNTWGSYIGTLLPTNDILDLPWYGYGIGNQLHVKIQERSDASVNFFSLCEVNVFGEIIHPVGKWGLSGKESCKCGPHESCSPVTGACSSPCFSRGQVYNATTHNCTYPCRPNCVSTLCQGKGDCPLCVEKECRVCRPGFSGGFCDQDCPKGRFGENCTSQCSNNCSDSLCNSISGDCLACPENKVLPRCIEKTTPEKDKEKASPEKDKKKDPPEKNKEKDFHYSYLVSLVALLPVLCCLCCCLFAKKRATGAKDTTNPEEPSAEDKDLPEERLSQAGSSVDS